LRGSAGLAPQLGGMPRKPFSYARSTSISYRQEAVSKHRGPRNRSVVGELVRDRFGSFSTELGSPSDVRYTPDLDRTADIAGGPVRGTKRTCRADLTVSAHGGKADISLQRHEFRF